MWLVVTLYLRIYSSPNNCYMLLFHFFYLKVRSDYIVFQRPSKRLLWMRNEKFNNENTIEHFCILKDAFSLHDGEDPLKYIFSVEKFRFSMIFRLF